MSASDSIYQDFKIDMERVSRLLRLMSAFRTFGGSASKVFEDDSWPEASLLLAESVTVRTDLPIISGSMLLYIAGRFEFFIRVLVENAALEISAASQSFDKLPNNLQSTLRMKTLEICQAPKRYGYELSEANSLLIALTDAMKSPEAPVIVAEVVSLTEANMRPGVLSDVLKRVEVKDFWKDVGKQSLMKLHLGVTVDDQCANLAQAELNSIMESRNQVAHPTSATSFPDHETVEKHIDFLDNLALITAQIMDVKLSAAGSD